MTALSSLISATEALIQDGSFSHQDITAYLNEGYKRIARGIMITYPDGTQVFSYPLSNLATSGTVTTSTTLAYVTLPTDYGRDLFNVVSGNNGNRVRVLPSFAQLLALYPTMDTDSEVYQCAIRGTRLYYQGIPSTADTLTLNYYEAPTELSDDTDEPEGIPEHLQSQLLTSYAAWQIHNLIEDGMDGQKVNTNAAKSRFFEAMVDLNMACDMLDEPIEFGII